MRAPPGGSFLFVERGCAPEPGVARWQDLLDAIWCPVTGGYHLNRQIDALVREAGSRIDRLQASRLPGPRTHMFLYEGPRRRDSASWAETHGPDRLAGCDGQGYDGEHSQ